MSEKYIYILYQLVDTKLNELSKEQYEFINPRYATERVCSINDGTRQGYYTAKAIESITGIKMYENGSVVKRELSSEEMLQANRINGMEIDRMNDDRSLYDDLRNIKQILQNLLERK